MIVIIEAHNKIFSLSPLPPILHLQFVLCYQQLQCAPVCSVSESHLQTRVSELEERVLQQNQDLDSHVHMIALLEAEKLEHMQGE